MLNAAQKRLVAVYADGDFAHVTNRQEAGEVGDTLFTFLFTELSTSEGCADLEEARRRTLKAMEELEEVFHAL